MHEKISKSNQNNMFGKASVISKKYSQEKQGICCTLRFKDYHFLCFLEYNELRTVTLLFFT